jgi:hypothetical protein
MIEDGRLVGPIFRKEFIKSQHALMQHIEAGSAGGKKRAENKLKRTSSGA